MTIASRARWPNLPEACGAVMEALGEIDDGSALGPLLRVTGEKDGGKIVLVIEKDADDGS